MKTLLLMLCACTVLHAHATNYYFSSGSGDDSRTSIQAKNPSTPWKSLDKLNSVFANLLPGDSILFKRGETFYGQMIISRSGTTSAPVVIGAYGKGLKPIITGFTSVANWVSLGGGIWESATAVSTLDDVNMVTINDVQYAMGRFPNATAANKGYLTIDSHVNSTSITDANLPSSPNWKGAKVVIRTNHWMLDTSLITSHTGTTLSYSNPPNREPGDGYGYFIENHPGTLDQFGEWYYNPNTKKIRVFFGGSGPTSFTVNVSNVENPVHCYNVDNIHLDNLSIQGANTFGIYVYSAAHVVVKNCDVLFCGDMGIWGQQADNLYFTAENNYISDAGNFGISLRSAGIGQVVRNNTVKKIGLFAGMGGTGPQSRTGIANNSSKNHLIEGNRVDSIGYAGIKFGGDYTTVKNNIISNFTLTVDDGGGIYTANQVGGEQFGRKVINNLVYNGIGAKEGTTNAVVQASSGIYIDDNSSGIEIAGNSVWNCGKAGLYVHNAFNLNIHDNTFYNNTAQILLNHDNDDYPTLSNVTFKRNIGFAKMPNQAVAYFYTRLNDIATFGTIDSNYYARPLDDNLTITEITGLYTGSTQVTTKHTLATWKSKYSKDAASTKSPKTFSITINPDDSIRFEYNATSVSKTVALNGTYMDVEENSYANSIVLQPYASVVLIKSVTAPVTAPKAPSVSLTSPTATISFAAPAAIELSASASDVDGSIAKVEFYNGTTLVATKTASPYTFTWQNVAAGTYIITAKATDNTGLATTSAAVTVSVFAPKTPTVSLTSPTANASFAAPATIQLSASAGDADGSISKVEFYAGTTLLATKTTSPYTFSWQNVVAGTYAITAKATDNSGLAATSAPVSVSVVSAKAPSVSLTSLAINATYAAPASIEMTATATDADGTISKVEFYSGTTLLATATASPYTFIWQNVAAGTYAITAKATDNSGLSTTSASVSVSVTAPVITPKAPSVNLTSPTLNASYTAPAAMELSASASDADGSIAKVEFYNGTTLVATKTASPYTFTWQNVAAGNYTITAKATDNTGLVATSAPVSVSVASPVAPSVNLELTPNPAGSTLYVSINGLKKSNDVKITILSMYGVVMKTVTANGTNKAIQIDVSGLPPQTYTLQAVSGFVVLSRQFVKL